MEQTPSGISTGRAIEHKKNRTQKERIMTLMNNENSLLGNGAKMGIVSGGAISRDMSSTWEGQKWAVRDVQYVIYRVRSERED